MSQPKCIEYLMRGKIFSIHQKFNCVQSFILNNMTRLIEQDYYITNCNIKFLICPKTPNVPQNVPCKLLQKGISVNVNYSSLYLFSRRKQAKAFDLLII
jgi:hypothetical protein